MKRTVSLVLTVLMVIGLFASLPITASAGTSYYVTTYSQFKQCLEKNEDCTIWVQKSFSASVSVSDRIKISGCNKVLNLNSCDPISITIEGDVAFCNLITLSGGSLTIKGMSQIKYQYQISKEYASSRKPSALVYVDGGTLNTSNCELYSVNGPAVKVKTGLASIGMGSNIVSQSDWALTDEGTSSGSIYVLSKANITSMDQLGMSSQGSHEGYGALCLNSPNTLLNVKGGKFGGGVQLKTETQTAQFSPASKEICIDSSTPITYSFRTDRLAAINAGENYYWYTYDGTYYYLQRSVIGSGQSDHPEYIFVNCFKELPYGVAVEGGTAKLYRGYGLSMENVYSADKDDEFILVADNSADFEKWQVVSGSASISFPNNSTTLMKMGSSDVKVKAVNKKGIESVAVMSVSRPVAGETGGSYASVPTNANYVLSAGDNKAVDWYYDNKMLSVTDKFAPGTAYEARIVVSVKNGGDKFAEDVSATINGLKADVINHGGSYIVISCFFLAEGGTIVDTSDFLYKTNDTGVTITGYSGSDTNIEIPSMIKGYKVTEIGNAFMNNSSIKTVNIPDTVTSINNSAFYNCPSLTHVTIADGVTSIGSNAFASCTALEEIVIPSSVKKITTYAFDGCTNLTDVILSEGLEMISVCAFYNCLSLTNIQVPYSASVIGEFSLGYCVENSKMKICPGFSITGYAGTAAQSYANKNGIKFNTLSGLPPETGGDWTDWMLYSQATPEQNGQEYRYKKSDPSVEEYRTIPRIASVKYTATKFTYNGKRQSPKVTAVTDTKGNKLILGTDYTVSYHTSSVKADTYSFVVFFKGNYAGSKSCDYMIVKASNPASVKAAAKTVKYSAVKKNNVTVSAITVNKAQGAVSYKKLTGNSKITVNSKSGKITVKKGLKKNTYKLKVRVSAKGNGNYKSYSKDIVVTIKVK